MEVGATVWGRVQTAAGWLGEARADWAFAATLLPDTLVNVAIAIWTIPAAVAVGVTDTIASQWLGQDKVGGGGCLHVYGIAQS